MIIDCHGHYTTEPKPLMEFRQKQTAAVKDKITPPSPASVKISDDEFRASVEGNQLRIQRERGTTLTLFSPRASGMGHHVGDEKISLDWSRLSNDCIHRVCTLFPENFIGVCQLPQSPGVSPKSCIAELERCVNELGFVGCNLNPDPSGGNWTAPPLTDRFWYPLYEKLCELQVPAMVHVSMSCNPNFHTTGAHYINADTTAFMQFIQGDLFKDFPDLKLIVPAWRWCGAVSLGPLPWTCTESGPPAPGRNDAQQHFLRHLRLPSARHRSAGETGAGRQYPFCFRNARSG